MHHSEKRVVLRRGAMGPASDRQVARLPAFVQPGGPRPDSSTVLAPKAAMYLEWMNSTFDSQYMYKAVRLVAEDFSKLLCAVDDHLTIILFESHFCRLLFTSICDSDDKALHTRMPPPPRPQSVHSWWSDSNKPGATIALHPLASRLSKLLYHRQVIGVIKRHSPPPLSEYELDALVPYLPSKELWDSTKTLILKQILVTSKFELGVLAILETELLHVLVALLQNGSLVELTCSVLESIFSESRKQTNYRAYDLSPTPLYADLGRSLLLYMRQILYHCFLFPNLKPTFQTPRKDSIDSVLPAVIESLASLPDQPHDELRILLGNVCSPLEENVVETILPYLESRQVSPLVKTAILSTISQFQFTDEILANTSFLSILLQLMESPDRVVLQPTCCIVCNIASYHSSPSAQTLLIRNDFARALVSVLRRTDASGTAVEQAVEALCHLSSGSWARTTMIIKADAIPLLAEMLCFHDPRILRSTCKILDYVASHQDAVPSLIIQFDPQAVAVEVRNMILTLVRVLDTGNAH
ncbi:hypothetical protein C8F04DRAFT_1230320, partial [Mycena alexandri]